VLLVETELTLDKALNIKGKIGFTALQAEQLETEVLLSGHIYGAFKEGKRFSRDEVLSYMVRTGINAEELKPLIRHIIGRYILVLRLHDRIEIFISNEHPGLFYTFLNGNLLFADTAKRLLRRFPNPTLNEMEVLGGLLSKSNSPFYTFFNGINRLPGGQRMTIMPGLHVEKEHFQLRSPGEFHGESVDNSYSNFRNILDNQAHIFSDSNRGRKIFVMLSGGIDSSTVLASVTAVPGVDVQGLVTYSPGHRSLGAENGFVNARIISEALKVLLNHVQFNNLSHDDFSLWLQTYREHLSNDMITGLMFLKPGMYLEEHGWQGSPVLSGHNWGAFYGIKGTKMPQTRQGRMEYFLGFRGAPKQRWLYSAWFQRLFVGGHTAITDRFQGSSSQYQLTRNCYDYLMGIVLTRGDYPLIPNEQHSSWSGLSELLPRFKEYKEETVLRPVVSGKISIEDLKSNALSPAYLNHIARELSYQVFTQASLLNHYPYERLGGYELLNLIHSGPLYNFFNRFQMPVYDIYYPKRLFFRYFREKTGIDYLRLWNQPWCNDTIRSVRAAREKLPRLDLDIWVKTDLFTAEVIPFMDKRKSAVLQLVQDETLKNYLINLYDNAREGSEGWPPEGTEFKQMFKMFNLEYFLRHL